MAYSPVYDAPPFTDFASVTPDTRLEELNLNWREQDLPEGSRTKHVHRLHPYLGKFVPQLVEIFLRKYQPRVVCDPFCGSGTTLVEANAMGIDAIGCDISPFNVLLTKVKTAEYNIAKLEKEIKDIVTRITLALKPGLFEGEVEDTDNAYLRSWYAQRARVQLLFFKSLIPQYEHQDLLKVILSRAARSARQTTHFDLDFPKRPQTEDYYCYKHGRTCQPTSDALGFLTRYCWDTLRRIRAFSELRTRAAVLYKCDDSRNMEFPEVDMILTSPPYVGLIDYHEQHRYAYELLEMPMQEEQEIGAAKRGASETAQRAYIENIGTVFRNLREGLPADGVAVIVVHDRRRLYEGLAEQLGYRQELELRRHVNRRTGRRAGDFYESVLVWRKT
ncbi:MAG: site-specific DNA-methyltransferase [Chloroflexi bacterium]|nr:site-specific DNA-methyltransferase [Chloroflexota bacterium]